jgi:membrane protein DedA with SNARE-associated domain
MHELIQSLLNTLNAMGYPGIFILMAMESSVIPVPSGSLAGAYANDFVSRWLGRPLVLKYGKYVWISEKKFEKVERFFLKHGEISTFIGRLLPVVRHLISIPAGIARMNHLRFSLYTLAGAGLWCTILTWIGYFIGKEQELILKYSHQAVIGVVVFCAVLVVVYVWRQKSKKGKAKVDS